MDVDFIPRMKDIIIDSLLAVKQQLNPSHRKNHFELLGYDFMIDEDLRTWLIEVNSNPYIGTPSDFTRYLVPSMIDEMMTIVLDPLYPPAKTYKPPEKSFQLIYQESNFHGGTGFKNMLMNAYPPVETKEQGFLLLNHRRPFNHSLLYPLEPKPVVHKKRHIVAKERKRDASIKVSHMGTAYEMLESGDYGEHCSGSFARSKTLSKTALDFVKDKHYTTGKRKKTRKSFSKASKNIEDILKIELSKKSVQ